MKSKFGFMSCFFILSCFASSDALSQMSAADTLREVVQNVKALGGPEGVVDYVNWSEMYAKMTQKAIDELQVKSKDELRDHFVRIFKDPGLYAFGVVERQISTAPEEKRVEMKEAAVAMKETLDNKMSEMRAAVARTEFTVGKVEEKGDVAQLELIAERDGQKSIDKVTMFREEGKWYLSSPNLGRIGSVDVSVAKGGGPDAGQDTF